MSDFKLIAIRPLADCSKEYSKVLERGNAFYYFYNDYKIDKDDLSIQFTQTVPENFYNIIDLKEKPININVSAIVGKNGTGKSTIIELLFMAINNISLIKTKDNHLIPIELPGIDPATNVLRIEFFYKSDNFYRVLIDGETLSVNRYNHQDDKYILDQNNIVDAFELSNFFYTIAINYSHYALNTMDLGEWVHEVFHKNDGYQTPLVINPMRTEGNIEINKENSLIYYRLLSNLLQYHNGNSEHRQLTEKQRANKLFFSIDAKKIEFVYKNERRPPEEQQIRFEEFFKKNDRSNILEIAFNIFGVEINQQGEPILYREEVENYIIKKIVNITLTYIPYRIFFDIQSGVFLDTVDPDGNKINLETLFLKLKGDDSHITFKLRQAINYLKYDLFDIAQNVQEPESTPEMRVYAIEKLAKRIQEIKDDNGGVIPTIQLIPPSILKIEIELIDKYSNGISRFNSLSSGEKQLIFSVNTIVYHLINIDSISEKNGYNKYQNVNIILEEIEMYAHPEMQRKYLNEILNGLKRIEYKIIQDINICFVTHSPFILSDIPNSNVLFLNDNGTPSIFSEQKLTFGSNIHDLLANDFFMNNGFMGEFAKDKIISTIKKINNREPINAIEKSSMEQLAALIGEPFIRTKLIDLVDSVITIEN